jgi:4-hydroxy-3-methylbut-2-enyl diphosphate reductase IspH
MNEVVISDSISEIKELDQKGRYTIITSLDYFQENPNTIIIKAYGTSKQDIQDSLSGIRNL